MAPLQEAAVRKIEEICDRHAAETTPLILILSEIQKEYGYIPLEVQEVVSERTGIPVADIYGVVTFYALFSMEPKGKYVIDVCLGTACYVKGSEGVLRELERVLGVKADTDPTPDGLFSVNALRCVGACGLAPVMVVNGKVYGKMTPAKAVAVVNEIKAKEAAAAKEA